MTRRERYEDQASRESAASVLSRYQSAFLGSWRKAQTDKDAALGRGDWDGYESICERLRVDRLQYVAALDVLGAIYPDMVGGFIDPYRLEVSELEASNA
jgi:hypothetical protein